MNWKISIVVFLFVLMAFAGMAQHSGTIRGMVSDSLTKKPVPDAEIVIAGQSGNTYSDAGGSFSIASSSFPCLLEIHILGSITKKVAVENASKTLQIEINCKALELSGVDISVDKPVELMPGKKYFITDYEFAGKNMILLAFDYLNLMAPVLLLTNENGDTLSRLNVWKPLRLCKDFNGKVFYMTKTTSFEIVTDNDQLKLNNPISNEEFEATNEVIIDHIGENYFLKKFQYNNQVLNFYNYDSVNDKLNCFRTICDRDNMLRNSWGTYFQGKEEDIRFQQEFILKPLYVPYARIADTIYLFNFTDSKLEKYSLASDTLSEQEISFQNDKSFKRSFYVDELQAKAYNLFLKDGISMLKEIDLRNGKILRTVQIPQFVYVENIKVHGGAVYFLYKEKALNEQKKLYRMKI